MHEKIFISEHLAGGTLFSTGSIRAKMFMEGIRLILTHHSSLVLTV